MSIKYSGVRGYSWVTQVLPSDLRLILVIIICEIEELAE
jgi:hypothetical protein